MTSHYMADVGALADRVLVIDWGQLTFDGDLAQLTHAFAPEKILKVQTSAPLSIAASIAILLVMFSHAPNLRNLPSILQISFAFAQYSRM